MKCSQLNQLESRMLMSSVAVTTTLDELDGNIASIADLLAVPGGNGISLREAVIAANNSIGSDQINLPAGTFTLTRPGADDDATAGDLDVTDALVISGTGVSISIIQAGTDSTNGIDKIFSFNPRGMGDGFAVTISGVSLAHGRNDRASSSGNAAGGAMDFHAGSAGSGSLAMVDVACHSNSTADGDGGAIAIFGGGTVNLSNVRLNNNVAHYAGSAGISPLRGGGLYIAPTNATSSATLSKCTFTSNRVDYLVNGTRVGDGGGIFFGGGPLASLTIERSNLALNVAGGDGGAIHTNGSTLIQLNTLIRSNSAGRWGGGLYQAGGNATLHRANFDFNSAAGALSRGGGGVFANAGTIIVSNSRIALNTAAVGASAADRSSGTITAVNTWWGSNDSPASQIASTGIAFSPWLVMELVASPPTVAAGTGQTSVISASITRNSANASGFVVPDGTPGTFSAIKGNIVPTGESVDGIITATWTVLHLGGIGQASAEVDTQTLFIPINITPTTPSAPDLLALSDSGRSQTDDLTNAGTLVFVAAGVEAAATVHLLRGETVVATRTGPGNISYPSALEGRFDYSIRQTISGIPSAASTPLSVRVDRVAPTAPTPTLQAGSDSGFNQSDGITNITSPVFDPASFIEAGATLEFLRGATLLATLSAPQAIQDGPLADGSYSYTTRVSDAAGNTSSDSSGRLVVVDTLAPTQTGTPLFNFATGHSLVFAFSENVSSSVTAADFLITNRNTGTTLSATSLLVTNTTATRTATVRFTGLPGTVLPDANYTARLIPAGVSDAAGNVMSVAAAPLDFYVLAGDLNRDRAVNFDDLLILAQNYGRTGQTFSQGNANYSTDGLVSFDDLLTLAQRYGSTLIPVSSRVLGTPMRSHVNDILS